MMNLIAARLFRVATVSVIIGAIWPTLGCRTWTHEPCVEKCAARPSVSALAVSGRGGVEKNQYGVVGVYVTHFEEAFKLWYGGELNLVVPRGDKPDLEWIRSLRRDTYERLEEFGEALVLHADGTFLYSRGERHMMWEGKWEEEGGEVTLRATVVDGQIRSTPLTKALRISPEGLTWEWSGLLPAKLRRISRLTKGSSTRSQ